MEGYFEWDEHTKERRYNKVDLGEIRSGINGCSKLAQPRATF